MTIKSEQVEVYVVNFIDAIQANIHVSKYLIPEIIESGSFKPLLQDKWWIWAGHKYLLHHRLAKDFEGKEK